MQWWLLLPIPIPIGGCWWIVTRCLQERINSRGGDTNATLGMNKFW
jgi:hypothetical protein